MNELMIFLLSPFLKSVANVTHAARPGATIKDFNPKNSFLNFPPVALVEPNPLAKSPENFPAKNPPSSNPPHENPQPPPTGGFWHGAQARKARPQTTPDWMSSLFAMARSRRSTSFSIPNLFSGPRHPWRLTLPPKRIV